MDLVERLRIRIHTSEDETALTNEAADEIERLREALGGVKDCLEDKNYIDAEMIVDHALQQKETE